MRFNAKKGLASLLSALLMVGMMITPALNVSAASSGQTAIKYWSDGETASGYAKYLHHKDIYGTYEKETFYRAEYTNGIGHAWNWPSGSLTLDNDGKTLVDEANIHVWALSPTLTGVDYSAGSPGFAIEYTSVSVNGTTVTNGQTVDLGYALVKVSWGEASESNPPKIRAEFTAGSQKASGKKIQIGVSFRYCLPAGNGGKEYANGNTIFVYNTTTVNPATKPDAPDASTITDKAQVKVLCTDNGAHNATYTLKNNGNGWTAGTVEATDDSDEPFTSAGVK